MSRSYLLYEKKDTKGYENLFSGECLKLKQQITTGRLRICVFNLGYRKSLIFRNI